MAKRPTVQSVDRTLDLLEALATRSDPSGISELAVAVGLHVSTAHRLLATLVERGYVRQEPGTARYHLAARVFPLAAAAERHLDLRTVARPFLERMMRASGETANLAICDRSEIVYLDHVASMHLVKMLTPPGLKAPLHCSGIGKIFLALRDDIGLAAPPGESLERRTAKTIVTRELLEVELGRVRRNGYAIDDEEMEDGVRCIAVPIFDRRDACIGALSVSGPSNRMTRDCVARLAPTALDVARELSAHLGWPGSLAPPRQGASGTRA